MSILALDIGGIPRSWVSREQAVKYHANNMVAWSLGNIVAKYRGGYQNSGEQSIIETTSIIAVRGKGFDPNKHVKVSLNNRRLFARDGYRCAYCARKFTNTNLLTRDHIIPTSRGGLNTWNNVVTACFDCNNDKSDQLLSECGLQLVYAPYEPNHWESLILESRNVLAEQMEYLSSGIPSHSRILKNEDIGNYRRVK